MNYRWFGLVGYVCAISQIFSGCQGVPEACKCSGGNDSGCMVENESAASKSKKNVSDIKPVSLRSDSITTKKSARTVRGDRRKRNRRTTESPESSEVTSDEDPNDSEDSETPVMENPPEATKRPQSSEPIRHPQNPPDAANKLPGKSAVPPPPPPSTPTPSYLDSELRPNFAITPDELMARKADLRKSVPKTEPNSAPTEMMSGVRDLLLTAPYNKLGTDVE